MSVVRCSCYSTAEATMRTFVPAHWVMWSSKNNTVNTHDVHAPPLGANHPVSDKWMFFFVASLTNWGQVIPSYQTGKKVFGNGMENNSSIQKKWIKRTKATNTEHIRKQSTKPQGVKVSRFKVQRKAIWENYRKRQMYWPLASDTVGMSDNKNYSRVKSWPHQARAEETRSGNMSEVQIQFQSCIGRSTNGRRWLTSTWFHPKNIRPRKTLVNKRFSVFYLSRTPSCTSKIFVMSSQSTT